MATRAWIHRERPGPNSPTLVAFDDEQLRIPATLGSYGVSDTKPWSSRNDTQGFCVTAMLQDAATGATSFVEARADGADQLFDERLDERRMAVVQLLYFGSYMHEFYRRLGFDAAAGALEGAADRSDPLVAIVRDVANPRRAWLVPAPDGRSCTLFTGRDPATGRLNALDADTVFHEYTHAVTQRIVGGSKAIEALTAPQSAGLAEAWSDYFALTVQNVRSGAERNTIGSWTAGQPAGARSRPYDASFCEKVGFANLGERGRKEAHAVGEVWAAVLMDVQRGLLSLFPEKREWTYALLWQVVFDSLPLLPVNPTFLEARDGMFTALGALKGSTIDQVAFDNVRELMWKSFAAFGLGTNARCRGPGFSGIHAGRAVP